MICVAGKSDFSSNSFRASITPTARFISNASLSFSLAGATKYQRLFQTTNSTKQMASNHSTKTKNMSVSSFNRKNFFGALTNILHQLAHLPQKSCLKLCIPATIRLRVCTPTRKFSPTDPVFFAKNKVPPGLVLGQLLSERACMVKKLREPKCDASIALPWK